MIKSILLVYNTDFIRQLIHKNFEKLGDFRVDDMLYGKEALKSIKEIKYDLVISDFNLYDIDGIEFIEGVKKLYPNMPVMLMASNKEHLDKTSGMNNVIPVRKPIDFEKFNKLAAEILHIEARQ